jgi:tRNA nucleotidyltransferase (CCA-adding enzyme)
MKNLINKITENGGTAMLIGGAVIDVILNKEIKDWDIEVYNLSYQELINILNELNLSVSLVGKSFGIIKTKINDIEIDLSIPRTENKIGVGHTDFKVILNPYFTPKEAGLRRDLTINSMYKNLHTGEIVDPFGGLNDLNEGIIRATNNETFKEDPLRVLRIMQLLARKGKIVAKETIELCQSMVNDFNYLPSERVFEEFKKLLLKSDKPSLGLQFLKDSDWLIHFPELYNLIGCQQNPIYHPEGDVWTHTLLVIDNAASIRNNIPEDLQLAFMCTALLHDVGKPSTTIEDLTSYGHDKAGIEIAEKFMLRLTNETKLINDIKLLVELHMRVGQLYIGNANILGWKRLHNKLRLDVLGWLNMCDFKGRLGQSMSEKHEPAEQAFIYFKKFGEKKIAPIVKGGELILLGWKEGAELGADLKYAFELQMDGLTKEEIIKDLLTKKLKK